VQKKDKGTKAQVADGKVLAILSYLSILCIAPLLLQKENKFILFHGKQGLVIFLAQVAVFILHIVLGLWILKLGMFLLGVISFLGIISVLQGKKTTFPVISDIAEQITL